MAVVTPTNGYWNPGQAYKLYKANGNSWDNIVVGSDGYVVPDGVAEAFYQDTTSERDVINALASPCRKKCDGTDFDCWDAGTP